jgi:hypothetical protein
MWNNIIGEEIGASDGRHSMLDWIPFITYIQLPAHSLLQSVAQQGIETSTAFC